MTVGRFSSAQALALRLIAKNGEKSSLVRVADGAPADAAQPWKPGTPTKTTATVDAAWFDHDITRAFETLMKAGDQVALLPATSLSSDPDPTKDLLVRVDLSRWTIVKVQPLAPNEDKILYTVLCRRVS